MDFFASSVRGAARAATTPATTPAAASATTSSPSPTAAAAATTTTTTAPTTAPFRLDEGFSEDADPSNQDEVTRMAALQDHVGSLSEHSRMEVAFEILQTLRAANIATVVERLAPYLHLDPMVKLPPEITAQIFEHLDAATLLTASLASHTWRNRILDSELWKKLYANQGWGADVSHVRHRLQAAAAAATTTDNGDGDGDRDMPDAGTDDAPLPSDSTIAQVGSGRRHPFKPRATLVDSRGHELVNWAFLYKQRQLLERNWTKGHYTTFQLPDPAFPHEAHTECVYTIQFVGKWLVSGSRDKTLRIWDLDTRRLARRPLTGHTQSVLCLQFDPAPDEDVIISGSTDSSVIVWRFSTGQKVHEIAHAHSESVLNLRFDRRYLVTCSKDKKIKIWNRAALSPLSPHCPRIRRSTEAVRVPDMLLDWASQEPSVLEAKLASGAIRALPAYQLLMTFVGHGAAVNAIQIADDVVVSASGDRLIKIWKIGSGQMLRSIPGHQKGIACVQFDSRRIVSGSSDNTVRIFDPVTGAEVAELKGHANLVRTVQAGFADLPGGDDDDLMRARAADARHAADLREAAAAAATAASRPSVPVSFGARLPPGGGGSKWGKIVSGSYDESIIIWRKNVSGDWVVGLKLQQDQASRDAQRPRQAVLRPPQPLQPLPQPQLQPPAAAQVVPQQQTPAQQLQPAPAPVPPPAPGVPNHHHHHHHHHHHVGNVHHHHHHPHGGVPAARVFKLQFDARRIVCCSQDSSIVGWDFANGDPEIEEACNYFTGP